MGQRPVVTVVKSSHPLHVQTTFNRNPISDSEFPVSSSRPTSLGGSEHHDAFFSSCASPAHVVIVLTLGMPTNGACLLCRLTQTTLCPSQRTRH